MKYYKYVAFACLPVILIGLSSCVHTINHKSLMFISLGMAKEQVVHKLGQPSIFRGSIINKFDQTIDVFEYSVDRGKDSKQVTTEILLTIYTLGLAAPVLLTQGKIDSFWLFFHDNKLVQWGKAGDWQKQADTIYEVRFR